MSYPRIPDVTIIGKYQIPVQTTEQITEKLETWLISKGYGFRAFPNVVEIIRIIEAPQVIKKKNHFEKLALTRDGFPDSLTLITYPSKEGKNFLTADVKCLPVMHNKLGQYVQFAFPRSSVEDAQRLCKDFVEKTMRVLGAEVLDEPYVESSIAPLRHLEFLYNTPLESNINLKAHDLIANSRRQVLLVGWVDRDFIGDLEGAINRGVKVRVLTQSTEGSGDKTVKADFKSLIVKIGKENIKVTSNSHDRFLICDNQYIIGSMYYTGSSKTRYESAIYSDDESINNDLAIHFERIWSDKASKTPT
jgi:hypothetical protein